MALNKVSALIDRKEIRDAFDLEFLLRKGVFPHLTAAQATQVIETINQFKKRDYAVKLGSLLPSALREYHKKNQFGFLIEKMKTAALSS